jgi:hypothetical protein
MNRRIASTAVQTTRELNRLARFIGSQGQAIGLPREIASDFQRRCAAISAIVNSEVEGRWDATQIGGDREVEMVESDPQEEYLHEYFDTQDEATGVSEFADTTSRVAARYMRRNSR